MKKRISLILLFYLSFTFAQQSSEYQEKYVILSSTHIDYLQYNIRANEIIDRTNMEMSVVFYTDKDFKYLLKKYGTEVVELDIDYIQHKEDPDAIIFIIKTNPNQFHRVTFLIKDKSIVETMKDYKKNHGMRLLYTSTE